MTNKDARESSNKKLLRLMRSPAKVLTKARDLYIHSLTGCAGQLSYGTVMGCPSGQFSTVPRSSSLSSSRSANRYSTTSTTTTQKEPMRSDSFKGPLRHVEIKPSTQQQQQQQQPTGTLTAIANTVSMRNPMPRSFSLGVIGRIDEDKPYCEFEEDDDLPVVAADVLLRSSSCCFRMNWT